MLKLTRRRWLGSTLAAVAAALSGLVFPARAARAAPPPQEPEPECPRAPRQRQRWIGHH